ncbi:MAG: ROK family transcriptional regulator [Solirubrobacterales bacterium]|nr:ROK family transcriptional regulator [Solirubrobacterales bacterium]
MSRTSERFLPNAPVESRPVGANPALRPGGPRLLRAINERALLERLRDGAASRAELARVTGLSKPTVSQALTNLARAGLVRETGRRTGERGRSAVLYEADPTAGYVAGIDVGRSWIRLAIADLAGTVVARRDARNPARSAGAVVRLVAEQAHATVADAGLAWDAVVHAVVGSPGVLDPATGGLRYAPNLPGWSRPHLVDLLREALTPSLELDNDANLAALGEAAFGRGVGVGTFAYLTIGTGVGMGVVVDGALYRGAHGAAGEVGFLPLAADGLGAAVAGGRAKRRGPAEEAAAAGGVVRTAREMGMTGRLTAERIFAAAHAGDALAIATVEREAERLAVVVAAVGAILDPELVVLGGGVGGNADLLLPPLERRVAELTPLRPAVVESALGQDGVVLGAIATALGTARDLVFAQRAGDGHAAA